MSFYPALVPAKQGKFEDFTGNFTGMDKTQWRSICRIYTLGQPIGTPSPVTGGLQHQMYHGVATRGEYAVKVLNPLQADQPDKRRQYEQAEQIARTAAHAGLPAVCALEGPDGAQQPLENMTVMIFPWYAGMMLPPTPADPDAARQIGSLLARLHITGQATPETTRLKTPVHSEEDWLHLAREAQAEQVPWSSSIQSALPDLFRWSLTSQAALTVLENVVTTHRDMDQKNVLWSDRDTPWILDWESAGLMNPALEVMGTALNWAGQAAGVPQKAPFLAFLRGYMETASLSRENLQQAAVAVLDKWLVWLKFNAQRSLPSGAAPPEERQGANGIVAHSLQTLFVLEHGLSERLQWCAELLH